MSVCLSACVSHTPQAHLHEFLDGQDLGFETVKNVLTAETISTWDCLARD
jgi:hypothetical protein